MTTSRSLAPYLLVLYGVSLTLGGCSRDESTAVAEAAAAPAANRGEVLAGQIATLQLRRTTVAARRAVVEAITAIENGIERPLYPESSIETAASIQELLVGPLQ